MLSDAHPICICLIQVIDAMQIRTIFLHTGTDLILKSGIVVLPIPRFRISENGQDNGFRDPGIAITNGMNAHFV